MHKKKKRISILSLYQIGNKGDEAILYKVLNDLCDEDFHVDSVAFSKNGLLIQKNVCSRDDLDVVANKVFINERGERNNNFLFFLKIPRFIFQLMRSDIIIFGGGHWIHDYNFFSFVSVQLTAFFFKLFRKKIVFYAAGIGPIEKNMSKLLIRFFLWRIDGLIVRDQYSKRILLQSGISESRIFVTIDPVVNLVCPEEGYQEENSKEYIVLSPCAWGMMRNYYERNVDFEERVFEHLKKLVQVICQKHEIVIMPTMLPEDYFFAKKFSALDNVTIVDTSDKTPCYLQSLIGNAEILISMRLHPVIFAVNSQTPFVCLNYDQKVKSFVERLNISFDACLDEDEFLDFGSIKKSIDDLLVRKKAIREELQRKSKKLKEVEKNNMHIFKNIIQ